MSAHPDLFPGLFVGMVKAGEVSGTLGLTLGRWADFSEHQVALRQRIRAALTYPVFMFIIGVGVLFFLMAFVVPTVTKIFADLGQALPWPTLILISVSDFLSRFWWALARGLRGPRRSGLRKSLRSESGGLFRDRVKLRVPLGGKLHRKLAVSRWSRTLGTLLGGGLPLLQALEFSREVVGQPAHRPGPGRGPGTGPGRRGAGPFVEDRAAFSPRSFWRWFRWGRRAGNWPRCWKRSP